MKFNLILGDDMKIKTLGEIVLRQGTHLMDSLDIELDGRYNGGRAYIEFEMRGGVRYVSDVMDITGNIHYDIPLDVTDQFGFGYMQITILAGGIIEKSAIFAFEVTSSLCSSETKEITKKRENNIFRLDSLMRECRVVTDKAKTTLKRLHDIENRLSMYNKTE